MAVTETDLALYLGLPPDDAGNLSIYLKAAKSKARSAGVPDFKHNAQYDEFILALAANRYDNRGLGFSGTYQQSAEENERKLTNSYVLELRYATEDPEDDEGDESG